MSLVCAAPEIGTLIEPTTTATGGLVASGAHVVVTARTNGTTPIKLDDPAHATRGASIALPSEVTGAPGVVADDGTVVYRGRRNTDVAVQALNDGVRVQMILDNRNALTRFKFAVGAGITPVLNADGTITSRTTPARVSACRSS